VKVSKEAVRDRPRRGEFRSRGKGRIEREPSIGEDCL